MHLLLSVRREVGDIQRLTDRARVTSTLFARANRVADSFGRRAAGLQTAATNRSTALYARRVQHLLLVKRAERLGAARRVRRDLREVARLLDAWATDPQVEQEGGADGDLGT